MKDRDRSIIPAQKEWMSLDPDSFTKEYEKEQLKEAQSRTGELSWLSQRTRPDICYTVNIMSALATRDPAKANLIGSKCLNYLNATKEWKIHYKPEAGKQLSTYTDSSYAPEGGKSHGGAVTFWSGCPIAWKSSRQALVTTSSAETELVEAHHGSQQMESVDSLLQDIGERAESRALYVDNAAAITLATSEGGSWKTRHLKVRHQALRQKVEDKWLEVRFCPGPRVTPASRWFDEDFGVSKNELVDGAMGSLAARTRRGRSSSSSTASSRGSRAAAAARHPTTTSNNKHTRPGGRELGLLFGFNDYPTRFSWC